jgi:CubicO group peptidase (beta-lactamase class C family)
MRWNIQVGQERKFQGFARESIGLMISPLRTRKPVLLVVFMSLMIIKNGFSQDLFRITYPELKVYEGTYEYKGGQTLEMAASPVDGKLYAIIGKARYALSPVGKDVFVNNGKQEVTFSRDEHATILGYRVHDNTPDRVFKLLDKRVSFSPKIWYARSPEDSVYTYRSPGDLKYGIAVGNISESGLDTALLKDMGKKLAAGKFPNMHSVLILKDNKLIFEEYFYEYDAGTLQEIRSATKSFYSALVGLAIDKKMIRSKNESVLGFFPEYNLKNPSPGKYKITVENLLTNQSGLDCEDDDPNSAGNENKMYGTADWVKFILDVPMLDSPGAKARYCSGGVITLGKIVEKVSNQSIYEFSKKYLFGPLGVTNYNWEFQPDASHEDSYGQISIRPRDMAKFGLLYLNEGRWNGKQIISKEWIRSSVEEHTILRNTGYGYLWWRPWFMIDGKKQTGIAAKGNGGQRIYLRPDLHLVVVITGGAFNTESSADDLLAHYILPAFK